MEIFQVVGMDAQFNLVVNETFNTNAVRVAALLVLFIVAQFFVVFRMTHKIYGPLVSIERFVGEIAEGNYDRRVVIRKGDELGRLVDSLNQMADSLDKRHSK
jgi:nitrate/nitrite-specific signal transduction histidine kinase